MIIQTVIGKEEKMVTSGDLRTPQFNGENYDFWSMKMETTLIAYDLWDVFEFGIHTNSALTIESKTEGDEGESKEATIQMKKRLNLEKLLF